MKQVIFLLACLCIGIVGNHTTFAFVVVQGAEPMTNGSGGITNYHFASLKAMSAAQASQLELKKHPTLAMRWQAIKYDIKFELKTYRQVFKEFPTFRVALPIQIFYGLIAGCLAVKFMRTKRDSGKQDLKQAQPEESSD